MTQEGDCIIVGATEEIAADGGDVTLRGGPAPSVGWRDDNLHHREPGPLHIVNARGTELLRLELSGDVYIRGDKAGSVPAGSVPADSLFALVYTLCSLTSDKEYPAPGATCTLTPGTGSEGRRDGCTHLQDAHGKLLVAFGPDDELRGPDDEPLTPGEAATAFREFLRQMCGV